MSIHPFPKRLRAAVDENANPALSGSSAKIYAFRPAREIEAIEAIEIVRECIRAAFGPGSIEQIAKDAAKPLRTSRASIRRIMDGNTVRFDGRVGFKAVAYGARYLPDGDVATALRRIAEAVLSEDRDAA